MSRILSIKKKFKGVSLLETIISLALIMLAFAIISQTFVWSKEGQNEKFKQRIEKRNLRYEKLLNKGITI